MDQTEKRTVANDTTNHSESVQNGRKKGDVSRLRVCVCNITPLATSMWHEKVSVCVSYDL